LVLVRLQPLQAVATVASVVAEVEDSPQQDSHRLHSRAVPPASTGQATVVVVTPVEVEVAAVVAVADLLMLRALMLIQDNKVLGVEVVLVHREVGHTILLRDCYLLAVLAVLQFKAQRMD
jgi:hypothetical protein